MYFNYNHMLAAEFAWGYAGGKGDILKDPMAVGMAREMVLQMQALYEARLTYPAAFDRPLHRLVREKGWVAFRELEYSICKRFARREKSLICLGGGTVRYEWNMDVLRGTGFFVLLTAPLAELVQRVRNEQRPRVNIGTSLEEDLRAIWEQSEDNYRRAADAVVDTGGKSIEAAVAELRLVVRRHLSG